MQSTIALGTTLYHLERTLPSEHSVTVIDGYKVGTGIILSFSGAGRIKQNNTPFVYAHTYSSTTLCMTYLSTFKYLSNDV